MNIMKDVDSQVSLSLTAVIAHKEEGKDGH